MDDSLKDRLKQKLYDDITGDPNYARIQVACPEIVLSNIPPELHAKLLQEATSFEGSTFNGNTMKSHGMTFYWNYDEPSQVLRVTCVSKPFYVTCGQIAAGIAEQVEKARTSI